MNKAVVTNFVSILFIFIGLILPYEFNIIILSIGLFALSGSVTNWLAIHMLFEKVPVLYGSGVILDRFNEIKLGIKNLAIEELFTDEKIEQFLINNKNIDVDSLLIKIDFDKVFEGLLDSIETSKLGSMLAMFGGRNALLPLKEPIVEKLKKIVSEKLNEFL